MLYGEWGKIEERCFFKYDEVIDGGRQDGWLSPEGDFYACEPNEHAQCATYVVEKNKISRPGDLWLHPRYILPEEGYVLISNRRACIPPEKDLTFKQLSLIEKASVLMLSEPVIKLADYKDYIEKVREGMKLDDGYKQIADEVDCYGGDGNPSSGNITIGKVVERFLDNPNRKVTITDNEEAAKYLLEMFSSGYEKELVLPAGEHDHDDYIYRVLLGGKLVLRMLKHTHDQFSEGRFGVANWHFRIITSKAMFEDVSKIVEDRGYEVKGDREVYENWIGKKMKDELLEIGSKVDDGALSLEESKYLEKFLTLKKGEVFDVPTDYIEEVYKVLSGAFSSREISIVEGGSNGDKLVFRLSSSGDWVLVKRTGKENNLRLLPEIGVRNFIRDFKSKWKEAEVEGDERLRDSFEAVYWSQYPKYPKRG